MPDNADLLGRKVVFKPGDVLTRRGGRRSEDDPEAPNRWWQKHREWSPDYAAMHQMDDMLDVGTIVGRRTLSNGWYEAPTSGYSTLDGYEYGEPCEYRSTETFQAYQIARTLYSKPVIVRVDDIVQVMDGPHEMIARYDELLTQMAKLLGAHRETAISTRDVIFQRRQGVEDARMGYRLAIKHMNEVIDKHGFGIISNDSELHGDAVPVASAEQVAFPTYAREGMVRFSGTLADLYVQRGRADGTWGPKEKVEVKIADA